MITTPLKSALIALALGLPTLAAAQESEPSQFGCSNYEFGTSLPAVEGKDGVFFRSFADLRLQHPMDDRVIEQLGRLSDALAANGTTLVYVAIPPKSVVLPDLLPERAAAYGFDIEVAEAVYVDILSRLGARGIVAPDLVTAMRDAENASEKPFFASDFHWSSLGAKLAAEAIGAAIKADPGYAELTPKTYETHPVGVKSAFSSMRLGLQAFCVDALPAVETMTWETTEVAADGTLDIGLVPEEEPTEEGVIDIFGASPDSRPDIVLVGTSFSDSETSNFAGFIQEYSGLEVVNYAVTGGNQFGGITSYLTSADFKEARPRYLIWENPVYNNLAAFGPGPMEELITIALENCVTDLVATRSDDATLTASFADDMPAPSDMISINYGAEGARSVDITLLTDSGIRRTAHIERSERLRATGRFEFWLAPYWLPGLKSIDVKFDRAMPEGASLSICRNGTGDLR